LERAIGRAAKKMEREEMRVCKQRDPTEKKKAERTRGVRRERSINPKRRKKRSKKNIPQRMLQTVNG